MTLVSDSDPMPVTHRPNTQEDQEEGYHCSPLPFVGASPEAGWEDDVPAAESDDDGAGSEDDIPDAGSEDDIPDAESEDDAAAAKSADGTDWEDDAPAAELGHDAGGEADTGEPDSPPRWWTSNSARRDPRKAELFRSLDATCEARRLQESRRRKPPPLPTDAGDSDEPIWPPKSPHWRRFRYTSSPATPALPLSSLDVMYD